MLSSKNAVEFAKFFVNGVAATFVHFGALSALVEIAHLPSAGVANFIAAIFGISASFVGNRIFVFASRSAPLVQHAWRFVLLYAAMASLHALILFVWTDRLGFDYRLGFVVASALQLVLSYTGNKYLVFRS